MKEDKKQEPIIENESNVEVVETPKLNIYQKLLKATEKIETVKKNLNVGTGNNQYKAVSEKDVLKAVKDVEVELGIYSYPLSRKIIETNVLTTTTEYKGEVKEKNQLFMRNETIYRFINTENTEEFVDITTWGDGIDSGDKAPGKAMTYADKYALLKAYKIETGDDPDEKASDLSLKQADNRQYSKSETTPYDFQDKQLEEQLKKEPIQQGDLQAIADMCQAGYGKLDNILKKYNVVNLNSLSWADGMAVRKVLETTKSKMDKEKEEVFK